ncbi:MAG: ammonium transporter [Pelosinus sp.]|nr:ammonium transporter [Pelosinus sp.]
MRNKIWSFILLVISFVACLPGAAFAEEAAEEAVKLDTGDIAYVAIASALVFIMTPALGFFYAGMARRKNVLNTMMTSIILMGIVSVQWVLFGYSISFGPDVAGIIGDFSWAGFNGVGAEPFADYAATIPHSLFALFQMMFAIITPAIIAGAIVGRMKFAAYSLMVFFWASLVYDPLCHMVWANGGFLRDMGALDFAGGTVVHISSGVSALVAALVLGKRKGYGMTQFIPHNVPFVVLGGSLLWVGWFGFNSGCALGANGLAITAFYNTNTAAAAAMLSWLFIESRGHGKPTTLGAMTGALAGLVVITPAAGYVTILSAIIMGLLVSPVCYFAIAKMKKKFGYDDSLDAFGCHGVGGMLGALLTGVFATKSVNPTGADGLLYGNAAQVGIQLVGVVVTIAVAAIGTFLILKVVSMVTELRATEEEEEQGMDINAHGEGAYSDL